MDKALEAEREVRVKCPTHGDAVTLRARCHSARSADRDSNGRVYSEDHPMHKRSVYDKLTFRIVPPKDGCYLIVSKTSLEGFVIEVDPEEPIPGTEEPDKMS